MNKEIKELLYELASLQRQQNLILAGLTLTNKTPSEKADEILNTVLIKPGCSTIVNTTSEVATLHRAAKKRQIRLKSSEIEDVTGKKSYLVVFSRWVEK